MANDPLMHLVCVLASQGPMTAGALGFELWARKAHHCKDENAQATMFCRPAGALLHQAHRAGLVRYEDRGKIRVWSAVTRRPVEK